MLYVGANAMPGIKMISFPRALVGDKHITCHNLIAKIANYELSKEWDMSKLLCAHLTAEILAS